MASFFRPLAVSFIMCSRRSELDVAPMSDCLSRGRRLRVRVVRSMPISAASAERLTASRRLMRTRMEYWVTVNPHSARNRS
jgi:hypothetical protein